MICPNNLDLLLNKFLMEFQMFIIHIFNDVFIYKFSFIKRIKLLLISKNKLLKFIKYTHFYYFLSKTFIIIN